MLICLDATWTSLWSNKVRPIHLSNTQTCGAIHPPLLSKRASADCEETCSHQQEHSSPSMQLNTGAGCSLNICPSAFRRWFNSRSIKRSEDIFKGCRTCQLSGWCQLSVVQDPLCRQRSAYSHDYGVTVPLKLLPCRGYSLPGALPEHSQVPRGITSFVRKEWYWLVTALPQNSQKNAGQHSFFGC